MNSIKTILFFISLTIILSCKKESKIISKDTIISGIVEDQNHKYYLYRINLKNKDSIKTVIDCYVLGSTYYNKKDNQIIFLDCNDSIRIYDANSLQLINSIYINPDLAFNNLTYDYMHEEFIGISYDGNLNYFIKFDKEGNRILKKHLPSITLGFLGCTKELDINNNIYYFLRTDSTLMAINTTNGEAVDSFYLGFETNQLKYDYETENFVALRLTSDGSYPVNRTDYITTYSTRTRSIINDQLLSEHNLGYYACVYAYNQKEKKFLIFAEPDQLKVIDINNGIINNALENIPAFTEFIYVD